MQKLRYTLLGALALLVITSGAKAQDMAAVNPAVVTASGATPAGPALETTETESAAEEETESPLSLSGYVDAYYMYNFNETGFPTSFTSMHNSFTLGMANLVLAKQGKKVGFMADLGFGPRADAANGYLTSEGGLTSLSLIKQLYVTYAPADWLTLTAGNFATFVGYEVIDAPVNLNYSTSYLFSYGPFYHTGVKANISLSDKLGLLVGVFNDTDTKIDVAFGKHVGAQLSYAGDKISAYLNYLGGRHADASDGSPELFSHQLDLTATMAVNDKLNLGLNSALRDFHPAEGEDRMWFGTALYANYAVSDAFLLAFRGEYMNDMDGIILGAADNSILALTLSANLKVGNLTFIPEFRIDNTSEDVFFDKDGKPTAANPAILTAVVYSF